MTRRRPRPQGFALLIVLWALVLLSLIFIRLTSTSRREAEITENLRDAAMLQARADGLVQRAVFNVMRTTGPYWEADGMAHQINLPEGKATIVINNLTGRINPNAASAQLMAALMHEVGANASVSDAVASAITSWRSPDAQGRFEAPQYRDAGLDYGPAGAPFTSLDELRLVMGMTPDFYGRLLPFLSLYNRDGTNAQYADTIVKRALTDVGVPGGNAGGPVRAVQVSVRIDTPSGRVARREADIALGVSPPSAGFKILSWVH